MGKGQPMEKKKKHFIAVTSSIILASLIVLITIVLAVTLTLPKGYTLVFNVDGQVTTSQEVKAKDEVVIPDPAAKDGYTFGGWYFDNDKFTDPCTPETLKDKKLKGENTIYAKWIKNDYTITYNLDGGINAKGNPSGYAVDTATIKLASPTKLGYTFGGWYGKADFKDKAITEIAKGSTGNKTLFAKWTKDTYTIAYELNGGVEVTANPTTYAIDTATITLNAPTKLGYTFGGWYDNAEFKGKAITEIATGSTGNKTLYAKWTAIEYGITYNLNDGTNSIDNPSKYTIATPTITLAIPTKLGYTFSGWFGQADFSDTPITEIAIGSTENKTFYANWTPTTYTIKYDTNGGVAMTDTTYDILTMPSSFAAPAAKTGYTFAAWYDNATFEGSPITAITLDNIGNKTLYAKWTAIVYGITYEPNSGTLAESYPKTYTIETETTLVGATRANYTFLGWCDNVGLSGSVIKTIPTGEIGDKKFYAKWEPVSYGITYELNGGSSANNPDTYTIEDSTIQLKTPTHGKNWMTFVGWFEDDKLTTRINQILTSPTGNKKVYAKWNFTGTPGLEYTLTTDSQAYEVSHKYITGAIGIPSKHNNTPVKIADRAFLENTVITSVVIDEGVTSIGDYAFNNCKSLTSIVIPSSVTTIGRSAFGGCGLTSVNIPSGVTSIGGGAFSESFSLETVTLHDGLLTIGEHAFWNCHSLVSIDIPDSVTRIGTSAFISCSKLTSVVIPSDMTSIETETFQYCQALTSVKTHSRVQSIGVNAFNGCRSLPSIFIPSSVTTISANAFNNCMALTISCQVSSKPYYWDAKWMGSDTGVVPEGRILWNQPVPKLIP